MEEKDKRLIVYSASAGTGKTYTLAARYIALLMDSADDRAYRHILAVTFTNKATAEMKQRILSWLYRSSKVRSEELGVRSEELGVRSEELGVRSEELGVRSEELGVRSEVNDFLDTVRSFMRNKPDNATMAAKAERVYHNILADYDDMRVSTIDAFLQQLITGMAQMLGIGADFGVELDSSHVVSTAVDEVMTGGSKESVGVLASYLDERMDDEKGWDVRRDLIAMTKELLRETVLKDQNEIELDPVKLSKYKQAINWRLNHHVHEMRKLYERVKDCKVHDEIDGGRNFYSFIDRIGKSLNGKAKNDDAFRGLGERDNEKLPTADFYARVSQRPEIQEILLRMQELTTACRKAYLSSMITSRYLNDLAMMNFVNENVKRNLEEANTILLARTAYVLRSALKPGDADFILEKAGIRYRHIMIDEFQDTSTLQWDVFRQLIDEMLASGGTTLIVGDVKQSIYRWRNGDYRIMLRLGVRSEELGVRSEELGVRSEELGVRSEELGVRSEELGVRSEELGVRSEELGVRSEELGGDLQSYIANIALTKNFRSQARVVEFNHNLFEHLCRKGGYAEKFADIYRETKTDEQGNPLPFNLRDFCNKADKEAGYVQVKTYSYKHSASEEELKHSVVKGYMMDDMFADIRTLIGEGAAMNDILILVRRNSEAKDLVNRYANSEEPHDLRLCSNDSFLLESSRSVQVVVNALKYVASDEAMARMYLKMCDVPLEGLNKSLMRLPLNELVEKVIKMTLFDSEDRLRFNDAPFLNSFIDEVGNYVNSYGSNVNDFLVYWNDELHKKAIPASGSEGVRIMTIHSAKGLESKYVFIPFCDWELVRKNGADSKLWHEPVCKSDAVDTPKLIPAQVIAGIVETDYKDAYEAECDAQRVDNLNMLYVALTRAADQLYVYIDKEQSADAANPKTVGDLVSDFVGDDCYSVGSKDIIADDKDVDDTPFEHHFNNEEAVSCSFCSSEEAIRFRQSQESLSYMQRGPEDADKISTRINAGNLRHDIFAHINTMADTDRVIHDFYTKGIIESQAEAAAIGEEMERAWRNPQMADWFGGGWRVMREVSVLRPKDEYDAEVTAWKALPEEQRGPMPKRELRPDRVMVRDGEAVVLDFKFGKHNHAKYSEQVKSYMSLLRQMGYGHVTGYLWYGKDGEVVGVE